MVPMEFILIKTFNFL